jgi:Seryl-tRNA synthetase
MLSRQTLREEPERIREALEKKGVDDVDFDEVLEVYDEWRDLKAEGDELRHERNEVSRSIGQLKQEGKEEEAQAAIDRSGELKTRLQAVEERADELAAELETAMMRLPMIPQEDVPVGADEDENVERRREGFEDLRDLPDDVTPHYDLGEELDILDFERGAKVSGGGYYFAKGEGARLEHALIQFFLDVHREQGYRDIFPPLPVNSKSMEGTGQFPKFTEDAYRIEGEHHEEYDDDDLWLLPTAEVPVTNMHRGDILLDDDLPLKYQAYSPNFRQEAGEHGTETRGIVRVHQFNKVELVNFVRPERATIAWRGSSTKPRRCSGGSTSPTASSRCVRATSGSHRPRNTTSRSGHPATRWRTGPRWAAAGSRSPRSRTSRISRPAERASSTAPSATKARSTSTRSTARASPYRACWWRFWSTIRTRTAPSTCPRRSSPTWADRRSSRATNRWARARLGLEIESNEVGAPRSGQRRERT